jgi:two-component system capsular synthesis sensor histidine kinase RcsC
MRILLVEDDPKNVELFVASLEDEHELSVERDGLAGERRALSERFDLILLDIQLPGRNGIDVCRSVRAGGVRTPIVALSASVLPDEVARIKEVEFSRFLSKPISPAALRAAVREFDDSSSTHTRATGPHAAGGAPL